ncbi:lysoplasmalogenase family protein [Qipengyuania atrilutea]|uniref:Lysoplasmalogenase n=1 Tax=Qipengyuania atrilutea TaxID=2744473 RepID=A0A850H0R9_9SPHN|nr:lysoplasmalogenase [Actirhodobacter atriluteus]NVD43842.1 lysoplasmalogenase [Actirhodobacter atriluteus]
MPRRSLVEHRPWLLAGVLAAALYYFLSDDEIGGTYLIALKGAAVGALALYAFRRLRTPHGILLTVVLAFYALGDMLIELYLAWGGAAFFGGHLAAILLFRQYQRRSLTASQKGAGFALLFGVPVLAWLLTGDWLAALYGVALGAMGAAAWTSAFPRYRVGTGAVLFVISDLLLFWREGPISDVGIADWLIWPVYYAGVFMIATGKVQTLRKGRLRNPARRGL